MAAAKSLAAITGASSGIGRVFARELARTHDLLLIARRRDRLQSLADELHARHASNVTVMAADLTDAADLTAVADRIAAEPQLELLINNAGFGFRGAFWEADLATLERMHRLHVMAVVKLSHAALRGMVRRNRGALVNVASVAAFGTRAGSASYSASKSWLAAFTEGLYLDLRHAGSAVKVQALCPGFTYSGFHDVLGEDRSRLAPPSLWTTAEEVVTASLRALTRGTLVVIPGWRYRLMVAILRSLPPWLKLRVEAAQPHRKA